MMVNRRKVCVIGLDGVGFQNFKVFLNSLSLNGMTTILNKGFVSSFTSIPPYTPCAWTSILTGVNPGKHGIYGFSKISRNSCFKIPLVTSYDVKYPRCFEMLAMHNLKSIVINVPFVYSIPGLVGLKNLVVISDWASPKQFIYPKQYEESYHEYLIEPPNKWSEARDIKNYVRKVREFLEKRLILYYELLEKEDYNLFIVVFSELDWLMHRIPDIIEGKRLSLIHKIISLIGRFIRRACELCNLVILVSDHGFSIASLFIAVNSILARRGLITYNYRFDIDKLLHRYAHSAISQPDNQRKYTQNLNTLFNTVLRFSLQGL